MSTPSRATLLNKLHKTLKRTYKHTPTKGDQSVLDTLLFACCLENARHDLAHESFAKLQGAFFDWNEIRVSTVKELAEVLSALPEAPEAAARLKGVLQSVFESDYSFDLEHLKKQNIGAAVKRLQKLQGTTPFNVSYVTQHALGGHSIPLDKGTLDVLVVLGVADASEAQTGNVSGMERAISKNKGQEFGAVLHELGAEFFANPFAPAVRDRLVSIIPGAKDRLPKRTSKKQAAAAPPAEAEPVKASVDGKQKKESKRAAKEPAAKKRKTAEKGKTAEKRPARAAKAAQKKTAGAKKTATKTLARRKPR